MLSWIIWNRTIFIKIDLALNNLQRLICHKNPTNQPNQNKQIKQKQKNIHHIFNSFLHNIIIYAYVGRILRKYYVLIISFDVESDTVITIATYTNLLIYTFF